MGGLDRHAGLRLGERGEDRGLHLPEVVAEHGRPEQHGVVTQLLGGRGRLRCSTGAGEREGGGEHRLEVAAVDEQRHQRVTALRRSRAPGTAPEAG